MLKLSFKISKKFEDLQNSIELIPNEQKVIENLTMSKSVKKQQKSFVVKALPYSTNSQMKNACYDLFSSFSEFLQNEIISVIPEKPIYSNYEKKVLENKKIKENNENY